MKRTWDDIPGTYSREIYEHGGRWYHADDDKEVEPEVYSWLAKHLVDAESAELVIHFRASGYYLPASMYGGPERLGWPAEGDEDRLLERIELWLDDGRRIRLPDNTLVWAAYEDEIYDVELDVE